MLIVFILVVLTLTFAYLFYLRNSELIKLQKYTSTLETDLLQKQIKAEEIAHHDAINTGAVLYNAVDSVTGLPTIQIFEDRAQQTLQSTRRLGKSMGILCLDVINFNKQHTELGLENSNVLLGEIAKRLNGCVRQIDTVTRSKADIFFCLLPQLAQPETAAYAAQRILEKLKAPFFVNDVPIDVSAKIGVAVYPGDGENLKALIDHANDALQKAKQSNTHDFYFYNPALQEISDFETKIKECLHQENLLDKLIIYCSPQINTTTGKLMGIKALPYIQDPQLGLLTYESYGRVAERENKMTTILEWLIIQAINQFQQWQKLGLMPERLAIGASAKQIQDSEFIHKLSKILTETAFDAKRLAFEISAENFSQNSASVQEGFMKISGLGVQLSIGVFALGHLAIQKVTHLPINYLKIDERLIRTLSAYTENEMILTALMDLSQNMGLETIVEGVNEEKQKKLLQKLGFEIMQGKLFGEPQPIESFLR